MSLVSQKKLLFKYRMSIPNRFRKSVISRSFSLTTHKNENSNDFSKLLLSGEVLKENFTDTFYTNLEVIAFSLFSSFPYKSNFYTHLTDLFQRHAVLADGSLPSLVPRYACIVHHRKVMQEGDARGKSANQRGKRCIAEGDISRSLPRLQRSMASESLRSKPLNYRKILEEKRSLRSSKACDTPKVKDSTPLLFASRSLAMLASRTRGTTKVRLLPTYRRMQNNEKNNNQKKNYSLFLAKSKKDKNFDFISGNIPFKKTVSLNIQIGDYLASGDKVGSLQCFDSFRAKSKKPLRMSSNTLCTYKFSRTNFKSVRNQCQASTITRTPKINDTQTTRETHFSLPIIIPSSGRVLTISKTQIVVQKTQPVLFYDSARIHVKRGEWVKEGTPILTLTHQTLITGDIVQGIPRIEQLFEAFTSPPPGIKDKKGISQSKFKNVHDTLHSQVRDIFRKYWLKNVLPIAVRKSLEEIQYNIVEMIQKVYLSQGVLIADKHIEIIIRQMTSKGQILDTGSTGLLLEEVLPIRQIENANITTPGKKCLYVPAVVGLTTAALTCDSFISAASFQETTRVLSRDAVVGKSDFLRGLKEKVVIGDLISAGTGLDIYFIYNLFAEAIS